MHVCLEQLRRFSCMAVPVYLYRLVNPCLIYVNVGSDPESKQSSSESDEDERSSSSRLFRRETRATRRAAQNKGAKERHGTFF